MALDPNKKFLYFNKDETSTEMDLALCFPVSSFIGIETQTSSRMDFFFEGAKGADATIVRIHHQQHAYIKNFMISLVDEINFGELAFIRVYDHAERTTHPSDVSIQMVIDVVPVFTLEDNDFVIADDVSIGGNLTFDSVALTNIQTSAESFVNDDISLMTSAAIEDKILSYGYSTTSGDMTGVSISVGTGLDISQSNTTGGDYSATVSLDLTEVGVDGSANQILTDDGDGTVTSESDVTYSGGAFSITSATGGKPSINLTATGTAASKSANLNFIKNAADTEDNELLGVIAFIGEDEGNHTHTFANIQAAITESDETDEAGQLAIQVATSDGTTSTSRNALFATGSASADDVDVTLGHGNTSTTTIAGTLTMGSTAAMTNAGLLSVANQSNITGLGTISSGTWEGTDVGVAHGGTGLSTVGANEILTGNGTGALTSEAGLTYDAEVLTIGDDDNGTATIKRKTHGDEAGGMLQISGGDATGTDKGGGILFLTGGLGTGTGGGGKVRISTASPDSSGSSANSVDWAWDFNNNGIFQTASAGYGITEIINFHTATFENVLSDGDHVAGKKLVYSPGANDTLADGQIFFLHTDGTWDQADASATSTGASQLLCVGNGLARSAGVILDGFVRIPSTEILNTPGSGAVDGLPLYVSTTAGHFDFTAPSGNDEYVRVVGYAIDDDGGDVLVYFNPDSTHVKITA